MKFLIQTIGGKVKHDFSFTLIQSCEYHNWLNNDKSFKYKLVNDLNKITKPLYTPIGSVEFVSSYLKKFYNLTPKPINVPDELIPYNFSGRNIINGCEKDVVDLKFVKSADQIKTFTGLCSESSEIPQGNYQISDVVDFISEWRVFVYQGEMVDLQNYSGDFCIFPDVFQILRMIKAFESAPIAYTLDVGVILKGLSYVPETVVVECHDFFSCGLYGFADHKILPLMFNRWFYNYINNIRYE